MRMRYGLGIVTACLSLSVLLSGGVHATSNNLLITSVQLGNVASASNELVELYNNSAFPVDITNWCLYYASASSVTVGNKMTCFMPSGALIHIFIPGSSYALAISTVLAASSPTSRSDVIFSATLSGTAGHVRLADNNANEIDKVAWGMPAASPETVAAGVPSTSTVLQRKMMSATAYQDNDNNFLDFVLSPPRPLYTYGQIYEVQDVCANIAAIQISIPFGYTQDVNDNCLPPPTDLCSNIDGLQVMLPGGFLEDGDGNCQPDSCLNMAGLQISIPDGMDSDANGNCFQHDFCVNFPGLQMILPSGFYNDTVNNCLYVGQALQLTELLPNPAGTDSGNEFIELYNPNAGAVDLAYYQLLVGPSLETIVNFPTGTVIGAGQYVVLTSTQASFTLVNSASRVGLETIGFQPVSQTDTYVNPPDGESWALVDGIWQYTDQPTPGMANLASVIVGTENGPNPILSLQACVANQYRSPDTNRCRLITTVTTTLVPCKDGQYRSEETNRCRTIALAGGTLAPCKDSQYRSEETNRCRDITSSTSTLKPCADNQYRSEQTNRCRTIVQTAAAPFPVQPIESATGNYTGWLVAGSVTSLALGYAVWEWRQEIGGLLKRAYGFIPFSK